MKTDVNTVKPAVPGRRNLKAMCCLYSIVLGSSETTVPLRQCIPQFPSASLQTDGYVLAYKQCVHIAVGIDIDVGSLCRQSQVLLHELERAFRVNATNPVWHLCLTSFIVCRKF